MKTWSSRTGRRALLLSALALFTLALPGCGPAASGPENVPAGSTTVSTADPQTLDLRKYGSLSAAVLAIGGAKATLAIPADQIVDADLTVPANIELLPLDGAVITVAGGTLVYQGPTDRWPLARVFAGDGRVAGLKEARPEWFGGKGDAAAVNDAAFQAAANSGAATILLSQGTYLFNATRSTTWEGGTGLRYAVEMKSDTSWVGGAGTILKMADAVSSNASPVHFGMFFSNKRLRNVSFRGILFDMNGANNRFSPATLAYNQAAIMFSGVDGPDAAGCDNLSVTGNSFLGYNGSNVIITGQHSKKVTLPSNNLIDGNTFSTGLLDTNDHSTVYLRAKDSTFSNNRVSFDAVRGDDLGVAVELQGPGNKMFGNTVVNYHAGAYITGNYTEDSTGITVSGNTFQVKNQGVAFFRDFFVSTQTAIGNVLITGNTVVLDDTPTSMSEKTGVSVQAGYTVRDVRIGNNAISKTGGNVQAAGVVVETRVAGQKHTGIEISGNSMTGLYHGVHLITKVAPLGSVRITGNRFEDLRNHTGSTMASGILVYSQNALDIDSVSVINNFFSNPSASSFQYGIFAQSDGGSSITYFLSTGNTFSGMRVANAELSTATIANYPTNTP